MTNATHLLSVSARIKGAILEFCAERIGQEWHADDLRKYVTDKVGAVAPASADRILRFLRAKKAVIYVCASRSASLYRVTAVDRSQTR